MTKALEPVLVGAGQLVDRSTDLAQALSPLSMMRSTAQAAAEDAGLPVEALAKLDALAVVSTVGPVMISNPPAALAAALGAKSAAGYLTVTGGNTPQTLVNHFADEIVSGRSSLVLLSGAEILNTLALASKAGEPIDRWKDDSADGEPALLWPARAGSNATERAHGMVAPIVTYPLFENALRRHYGRTHAAHQQAIGELFSPFTAIARDNPHAWFPTQRSAEEIATPSPQNRYIGFPYTKYMNAVMQVNQSASVLLTSDAKARELGIDESRWVYLHGHCDINDIWFVSERLDFHSSPALKAGLEATLDMAAMTATDIDLFDVYSCFPAVVEITRDALGMKEDDPRCFTVTGGLPYFGGAGNNYSMHAIATMMDRLREAPEQRGLVTANGWYLTKHALGIYGGTAPEKPFAARRALRPDTTLPETNHPRLDPQPSGTGTIETYTVMFSRAGEPERGLVLGRLATGNRFIADLPPDPELLEQLVAADPIGSKGQVSSGEPVNEFRPL